MRPSTLTLSATFAFVAWSSVPAHAHGGSFRPPPPRGGWITVDPGSPNAPGPGAAGPATPGPTTPGPSGPAGPSTGGGQPRPVPATPPGRSPLAPGPLPNPYLIGGEEVSDVLDWRLWWELNRDRYLDLSRVRPPWSRGGDDFFLGKGQRERRVERLSPSAVDEVVVPALMNVIKSGGEIPLTQATILAVAKASAQRDPTGFGVSLRHFVATNPDLAIKRVAALSWGVFGSEEAVEYELLPLLRDDEAGRERSGGAEVDPELRAFAAYALALLAGQSRVDEVRRAAVRGLEQVAADPSAPDDLRASAFFALGFVPLGLEAPADLEPGAPHADLAGQVEFVLSHFLDGKLEAVVRAQAAGALGRLVEHGREDLPEELRWDVIDVLVRARMRDRRQPHPVRENAVLALALMGDADQDLPDRWVHYSLRKAFWTGGPLEKRFALLGMGQVAGRAGRGEGGPYAESELLRGILLHHMSVGRRETRAWAALGLGLLGHGLRASGVEPDAEIDLALRTAIVNHRKAEDLGAFALAAGLRRDPKAVELLLDRLERVRDPAAKGYVALALGLIGDEQAVAPLRELLEDDGTPAPVRGEVGLALGLLGDSSLVPSLVEGFQAEDADPGSRIAFAKALGSIGDERAIDPLVTVFRDDAEPAQLRRAIAEALGRLCDPAELPWRARLAWGAGYHGGPVTLTNPARTGVLDLR